MQIGDRPDQDSSEIVQLKEEIRVFMTALEKDKMDKKSEQGKVQSQG